ncbi:MAG: hypothetical protein P8J50_03900 [Acidimicrobiales bacterium]|nr:hypothetical protein [Acidimicrobiales bacterium]
MAVVAVVLAVQAAEPPVEPVAVERLAAAPAEDVVELTMVAGDAAVESPVPSTTVAELPTTTVSVPVTTSSVPDGTTTTVPATTSATSSSASSIPWSTRSPPPPSTRIASARPGSS